ncbi:MAG: chemotaxis protein CheX [Planctomycetes bacterium]|nr:chemotaxis protein CheX [Planctomycetota bacterium]
MTTVSTQDLHGLVTNALERMAFVFTERSVLSAGEVLAQSVAHASVELTGARRYVVTVSATPGMVQEIASGMMGCDPHEVDPDDHGRAVVTELANVLGGELVVQLQGDDSALCIGLPREVADEEAGRRYDLAHAGGLVCTVDCDDGSLSVSFAGA